MTTACGPRSLALTIRLLLGKTVTSPISPAARGWAGFAMWTLVWSLGVLCMVPSLKICVVGRSPC